MPKRPKALDAELVLSSLPKLRMAGLTKAQGRVMAEAGSVCLEDRGHAVATVLHVEGAFDASVSLRRLPVTDHLRVAHNFATRATDHGACGVAILLVFRFTGMTVLWEAKSNTGYDYWIGADHSLPFSGGERLEVSGIRTGDARAIAGRVREKQVQTQQSHRVARGYIVVVEFSRPIARVVRI